MRSTVITFLVAVASIARADVVVERWGSSPPCRHPQTAEYSTPPGGGLVVKYDLSALPKGAKVYRARLLPGVGVGAFPQNQPLVVKPVAKPANETGAPTVEVFQKEALALVAPRYVAFDATDVVTRWASGKLPNHGLLVQGQGPNRARTFLEVAYEGQLKDPPPPATDLKGFSRAGQVFLTWKEIDNKFFGQQDLVWKDYKAEVDAIRDAKTPLITYRIYRHTAPITPANLGLAELLDEVGQFSCFDDRMVATEWKGEQIKNVKVDTARVPRTCVQPKTELPVGVGVYVKTIGSTGLKPVPRDGTYHYAVVSAVDGVENTTRLDAGNTTPAIQEKVAPTEPIPFKEFQMQYQLERCLFCYIWWVEQPLAHLPNFIHVGVSAGPKLGNPPAADPPAGRSPSAGEGPPPAEQAKLIEQLVRQLGSEDAKVRKAAEQDLVKAGLPAVVVLEQAQKTPGLWGQVPKASTVSSDEEKARIEAEKARLAEVRDAAARTIVKIRVANVDKASPSPLLVEGYWWSGGWNGVHPAPQEDGLTLAIDDHPWHMRGIHGANGTLKAWSQDTVQNFYIRQIQALLPWVKANYNADLERVYAFSGGWAWHYPDIFAATFEVLSMNPKRSPAYTSADGRGPGEVQYYWGNAKNPPATEWGISPYEYWNTGQWVKEHPAEELAFMSYTPYQHTGDFGRLDKPAFFAAMRDTRHAFASTFEEGRGWYGTADADWIFQVRKSDSIAAFTNSTLDDNPGIGAGGDPGGQINAYLAFDARGQSDQPDKWEMTVYLVSGGRNRAGAPLDACTTDVTPRRCQKFKGFKPGDKFTWTNTSLSDNKVIQTGQTVADQWGLVTATGVTITKGKNRLAFQREK